MPPKTAHADFDAVARELTERDYEPLIETDPYPLGGRRRIYLIGHGGYLTAGRVGWLLRAPGERPRSLRDAQGQWVRLDANPSDVASAVAATDHK
jgi:hypothetical protein